MANHGRFEVFNVVNTMSCGKQINSVLSCLATHGKLSTSVFPASFSKSKVHHSTNAYFESGKLVNTGSRTIQSSLLAAQCFIDRLQRWLGLDLEIINFEPENTVVSTSVGFQLNLNLLLHDLLKDKKLAKWEPKVFPGLKLSMNGTAFIMFRSGSIINTGLKSVDDISIAEDTIEALDLRKYELGKEYCSMEGVEVLDAPQKRIKAKKPIQLKVINHSTKREQFKSAMKPQNRAVKKRPAVVAGHRTGKEQPPAKRQAMRSHIQYPAMGELL